MAGFLENLSKGIEGIGTTLGLPEFGISEQIGNLGKVTGQADVIPGFDPFTDRGNGVAYNPSQPTSNPQDLGAQSGNLSLTPLPQGGGLGSGAGNGQPSQGFLNSLLQQAGQGIQQGYDATLGQLGANANFLKQQSGDLINQADTMFNQQKTGFENQRSEAFGDLDRSRQEIDANKSEALSDLSSDLRTQMESFSRMLGAMGAADSSAAGMGQYAYGRMGQQARSDIWKQANDLVSQVNVRREKVNSLFSDNMRQLADWKTNQLGTIENDFKAKMQQIEQAKMQADAGRIAQLNDIQMQIQQQAMTTALQVDQRVASMAASSQQWAKSQAQNLDGLKNQLSQSLQAVGLNPVTVDPLASTQVNNGFAFGANDVQRGNQGQGQSLAQVTLPTNRRDENAI